MNPDYYLQKPPEFIFKYFRPARVDILKGLRIRFANPATFNDPFEVCPRFDLWAEDVANAALKELTAQHPIYGISPVQSASFVEDYKKKGLKERVRFHSQHFQKECGERFRVLCFSENVHSPLMWGHYCDCHEGFALQFDTKHQFFQGRLAKVHYDKERPKINGSFPGLSIPLTKNEEWSYEREWRIIQETTSAMPYYEALPVESIKAIYFGIRMTAVVRREFQAALDVAGRVHIQRFDMDLDPSTYKLNPIPVIK